MFCVGEAEFFSVIVCFVKNVTLNLLLTQDPLFLTIHVVLMETEIQLYSIVFLFFATS